MDIGASSASAGGLALAAAATQQNVQIAVLKSQNAVQQAIVSILEESTQNQPGIGQNVNIRA